MLESSLNEPTKIFLTFIPRFMRENDVKSILEEFGQVLDLSIVRDKRTGESVGSCFATFNDLNSAKRAQESLHLKRTLITMNRPIEV